ncbi:FAD-dependent monooxygenase [Nonomuraea rubra]|uniref:FAD-dependent monooxygenase n=1 Tax=Nonomuraea rubra TaxID=46180 RepID=UPI00360C50F7
MRVVIAGAGIAGLTAALSLHAAGISDVTVHEAVAELHPLGVGINILPHAIRELIELGLADRLAAIGVATADLTFLTSRGQHIWSEPRGQAAGYRWPQYSIHRGRLQMMLLEAVRERLGPGAVVLGSPSPASTTTPTCSWAPTASAPPSGRRSSPARASRCRAATCCGAAPRTPSRS